MFVPFSMPKDFITSTHRGHGHVISKGADVKLMMAELFGKKDGYCKGKGGSMHIADIDKGILGANGIVGGGQPIATGAALACKKKKTGGVAICFFGDGATNRGTFHESINLAALWALPVIYVIENNYFGEFCPIEESCSVQKLSTRASAYGIPGITVDGNDVLAVRETAAKLIERARNGEGPSIHENALPGDTTAILKVTPVIINRPSSKRNGWLKTPSRVSGAIWQITRRSRSKKSKALEEKVDMMIADAVEFATNSPDPELSSLLEDV